MHNLIQDPDQQERVFAFNRQVEAHMTATDDSWAIEAVFPPPNFETHTDAGERVKEVVKQAILES
jgi:hypothetical protein